MNCSLVLFENERLRKYERSVILCYRSTSEAFTLFSNKKQSLFLGIFYFLITTHFVITYAFCGNLRIRVTAFGNNGRSTQFVTTSGRKNNIQTIERKNNVTKLISRRSKRNHRAFVTMPSCKLFYISKILP